MGNQKNHCEPLYYNIHFIVVLEPQYLWSCLSFCCDPVIFLFLLNLSLDFFLFIVPWVVKFLCLLETFFFLNIVIYLHQLPSSVTSKVWFFCLAFFFFFMFFLGFSGGGVNSWFTMLHSLKVYSKANTHTHTHTLIYSFSHVDYYRTSNKPPCATQ